jgi:F-type H+-transporting ATPase subunit b
VAYFVISRLLFKPYLKAYHKRLEVTFGNQEAAEKLIQEVQNLHIKYEAKAREVNSKVQSYFEQAQKEAQAVQATTIENARVESEKIVQSARNEIQQEINRVRATLSTLVPELSHEIERKILNREIS